MKKITLDEVCELIVDCEHKTAPKQDAGYPSIRTPNIGRGYFILENVNRVSRETYEKWTQRAVPRYGDLIIAREAPVGNVAMIPKCLEVCLGQRTVLIRPDQTKADSRFLTYLLLGDEVQGSIHSQTNGATVAHLNMRDIRSLELPFLPDLPTQRKIAGILSAYDDLIENNLRRIKILEEMARTLYREWFVYFRYPGYESAQFVESSLGQIPESWQAKRLDELSVIKGGKQLAKSEIRDKGQFPVYGGNGIQGYAARSTHSGFVIPFGRVGANCGAIHWTYGGAWLNNNSSSIVPEGHDELVLAHLLEFNFTNLRGGAAQPFISNTALSGIEFVMPPARLADRFCAAANPLRLQQINLIQRNQNLRRTRDLLLPKLLAGNP